MSSTLTPVERKKLEKLKGLKSVLDNYIILIEFEEDPLKIQEAIEAVDYYDRLFKELEDPLQRNEAAIKSLGGFSKKLKEWMGS